MTENKRILIVDDNEEFCKNITDILEATGEVEAVAVYGGMAALESVSKSHFDLILLDVKMPAMDGLATSRELRRICPETPVIMITAFAVEELLRDALREGVFGSLHKPIDFERLFALIEAALCEGGLILVVDDDAEACCNLRDVLSERDYRVAIANTGEEAIQKVREERFDVMILDMKLPAFCGLETFLAARDLRPDLATILITGHGKELSESVQEALDKGAHVCLEKPVDMDVLLTVIKRLENRKGPVC